LAFDLRKKKLSLRRKPESIYQKGLSFRLEWIPACAGMTKFKVNLLGLFLTGFSERSRYH
jgi:hypothetical protein